MRGEDFCFWHQPDYKEESAQARKLGGQRRRPAAREARAISRQRIRVGAVLMRAAHQLLPLVL